MTVGILGGGQLGQMLAQAGFSLGIRTRCVDPSPEAPAALVTSLIVADYKDHDALVQKLQGVDVVTYEFENVPVDAARALSKQVPVSPQPIALEIAQDRLREKQFFQDMNIPTARYYNIDSYESLKEALDDMGTPAVLKTRQFGYDGKGQYVLHQHSDAELAWRGVGRSPSILEQWIPFKRELSILGVRSTSGELRFYPLVENYHRGNILRISTAPARGVTDALQHEGELIATRILEALRYVGVLAVEMFEWDGKLLANEIAPRVHNSGHWTIEGAATSQFENHLRAVCGLPLGSTKANGLSVMINLIGVVPPIEEILAIPRMRLHLYGKAERPGRKLGHVTITGDDDEEQAKSVLRVRRLLNEMD